MTRSFLFLQGTASPFFAHLAATMRARGHRTVRVNFCGGDRLYAGDTESIDCRVPLTQLRTWYADQLNAHGCADVVLFGDCRPIHHPAHDIPGVRVHVFEEGYVRPHWLTLERYGVNGRSTMPRDPDWFIARHNEDRIGTVARPTGYSLSERAWHDIRYRLANAAYAHCYPHYRSHRPRNGLVEYAGLANRFVRQGLHKRHAQSVTEDVLTSRAPYFLFPLQLGSDSQIVVHSPFSNIREVIDVVIGSFARDAPRDALLLVKNHPLDTGLVDYRRYAFAQAHQYGVEDRLRFLEAGHLPTLLDHARGVIVVNSTVGLSALHHGRPLMVLGEAIYDMKRLTWQHGLARFWREAVPPDMEVYWAFLNYVIKRTQINGDFYTKSGIAMAVGQAARRIEEALHD
ncbi:capsular biosynthesis protein [Burkholderia ubonensis]|uniref:capsule biosynthesis protein n=1 Tax=Burkholderia ubonensis TaxID=101571 RepID=UPI000753204E|nr:capsular biosynthesis protein [Burkholderia ubonensis]KVN96278.1 capsular biosynthesis protein [Burkholderia ubonensis]